jgi:hypothetical protein
MEVGIPNPSPFLLCIVRGHYLEPQLCDLGKLFNVLIILSVDINIWPRRGTKGRVPKKSWNGSITSGVFLSCYPCVFIYMPFISLTLSLILVQVGAVLVFLSVRYNESLPVSNSSATYWLSINSYPVVKFCRHHIHCSSHPIRYSLFLRWIFRCAWTSPRSIPSETKNTPLDRGI